MAYRKKHAANNCLEVFLVKLHSPVIDESRTPKLESKSFTHSVIAEHGNRFCSHCGAGILLSMVGLAVFAVRPVCRGAVYLTVQKTGHRSRLFVCLRLVDRCGILPLFMK